MSTNEPNTPQPRRRINPFVIAVLVVGGLAMSGLAAVNGAWTAAILVLVWMFGIAIATVVFARRSDTVAMLADDVHEERNVQIHRRAALTTLNIVAGVIIVAGLIDIARGGDGDPYFWLAAVAGVTYLVSLLIHNRRY